MTPRTTSLRGGTTKQSHNLSMIDFTSIEYLRSGNAKQQHCYTLLQELGIFEKLKVYAPLLTGTIPIGIDTDISDLDIICEAHCYETFDREVEQYFGNEAKFAITKPKTSTCIGFWYKGMEVEIYANSTPAILQNAYRHMLVEYRLLNLFGESFKKKIIELKQSGLKTEPAFAKLLSVNGNPYDGLLTFEQLTDEEILRRWNTEYTDNKD